MKLKKRTLENAESGSVDLPVQFAEEVRPDLIKRAVLSLQAARRQPYGHDPEAGMKHSPDLSRRRRKYRGSYGHGISRVPRKIHSRNGTRMNWTAAEVSNVVGGRRAHGPLLERVWDQKVNKKERRKAIRSALAATADKAAVGARGHVLPDAYPFVLDNKLEDINNTKALRTALAKLGFTEELNRVENRSMRAGKGKMRNRRFRQRVGPLLVVSKNCAVARSARNLPGVEVVIVDKLNAEQLAPGANAGRLTLFTEGAVERLSKENLFC